MDVEVLKSEKKMILERANTEKRELTQEEKDRCHVIDKQVYDIENGFFNPSGFIKTSVKVNITPEKDDVPIPHVELKQEQHDVYVPPVGAKEVMEYDKMHEEGNQAPSTNVVDPTPTTTEIPVVEEVVESTPIVEPIAAAPVNPEPAVEETINAPLLKDLPAEAVNPEPAAEVQAEVKVEEEKPKKSKNIGLFILIGVAAVLFTVYIFF